MHTRRGRVAAPVGLGTLLLLASMVNPGAALACLPYEAASNFSFTDGLSLAVVGRVTEVLDEGLQERASVIVTVGTIIAGTPGLTVEVAMDPEGGCTHPPGEIGDLMVVAAGAPGADYGVFAAWSGGPLSPYNSAQWIVGPDGGIGSGPTLDGREFASLNDLELALRSWPNTVIATPTQPEQIVLPAWAFITTLIALLAAWFFGR